MTADYYQSIITQKSWELLKALHKRYKFTLIGGWAVFLYTKALKSKDIDIIIDYEQLAQLQKEFPVSKNDRLKKYEIKKEEVDVDIYVPFYSNPGLPIEEIQKYVTVQEGFRLPKPEILLILKQNVYQKRKFSAKGQKDRLDILALVTLPDFNFSLYRKILAENKKEEFKVDLTALLHSASSVPELRLNAHRLAQEKKRILFHLGG